MIQYYRIIFQKTFFFNFFHRFDTVYIVKKKHIQLILSHLSILLKLFSPNFNNHYDTPTAHPPSPSPSPPTSPSPFLSCDSCLYEVFLSIYLASLQSPPAFISAFQTSQLTALIFTKILGKYQNNIPNFLKLSKNFLNFQNFPKIFSEFFSTYHPPAPSLLFTFSQYQSYLPRKASFILSSTLYYPLLYIVL